MLRNYLLTALRNFRNNRIYSFLNVFGLAIGIACAGLIFLWVESEFDWDKTYSKRAVIYRIMTNQTYNGEIRTFDDSPGPLADAIKKEVPGIVNACRTAGEKPLLTHGDTKVYETGIYADPSFFDMMLLPFIEGKASAAFPNNNSVVITERTAKKFFSGNVASAVGQTLTFNNKTSFTVTGVIRDMPDNSTIQLDFIAPFEVYIQDNGWLKYWGANGINTYAELAPTANAAAIQDKLTPFIHAKDEKAFAQPVMIAMNDWHLRDVFIKGKPVGGRIEYVRLFTWIAWIILLIACINFMNLATARSGKRSREVGVRKVLGAGRQLLVVQFIGESLLLSALSVLLGVLIIALVLPLFNTLVGAQLTLGLGNPMHWAAILVITVICGLVAGSYPALYLSSFNPIYVFKGLRLKGGAASVTRKSLVVVQFTVSIVLIVSTFIIYRQVQHVKSRDLGYNRNNLLDIKATGDIVKNYGIIREDLLKTGLIENTGLVSIENIYTSNNSDGFSWEGKDTKSKTLVSYRSINADYLPTMEMKIVEGRNFSENAQSDSNHILITETLAHLMGKGSPIGKKIYNGSQFSTIVGVVKDYVYGNMYDKPDPVIFFSDTSNVEYCYIRVKPGADIEKAIAAIGGVIRKDNPAFPFTYSFVDDQFNKVFTSESLIGKLSGVFAALAIFISCLGLFGLAAYTAEQRTREIGIRKVLGASTTGLAGLLSADFLKLVLISNVVALPLAWLAMNHWLEGYAYRISISWWMLAGAALTAMIIALLTVSFQAMKAALMNPVKSLRSE